MTHHGDKSRYTFIIKLLHTCICSMCPKKGDKLKVDKRVGFYHTKNNEKKSAINRDILNVKKCVCVPIFVRKWTEYFINSFFFCVILTMVPFQFALCVALEKFIKYLKCIIFWCPLPVCVCVYLVTKKDKLFVASFKKMVGSFDEKLF